MKETLDKIDSPAVNWPLHRRLVMMMIGYLPILHAAAVVATTVLAARRWGGGRAVGVGLVVLYLLPPIGCRIAMLFFLPQPGRHSVESSAFLKWWLSAQWQVIFNRLPMLEELLRLVPGLYSLWLRAWGAKVGSLVYWSPGLLILDRPFVRVGRQVLFGAGVRVNPHIILPRRGRSAQLWLGFVTLGDNSLIGGYSLITAGSTIAAGQTVPTGRVTRPFLVWHSHEPAESAPEGDPV